MQPSSKAILKARRESARASGGVTLTGWVVLTVFMLGLITGLHHLTHDWRWDASILAALVLFGWRVSVVENQRRQALAASRPGESICQFARSFHGPEFDPVLIRATYECVQEQLGVKVPVRESDRFERDLNLDGDDMDDVAHDVSRLAARSFSDTTSNPYYEKVETVGDFVRFFLHQPRLEQAA